MDNIQPGQTIGPYRILNQVGQGGMATVYRAYHSAMDRYVALKVLPRKLAETPEFVGRFRQEARTIARLEHAHILPVHDYGEAEGFTYLAMRYLEAGTLKDRLQDEALPLREVDRIFSQLADALDYAHGQGVIHRDLKPSNVLLDARANVFLTDFGIAKLLQGDANFTSTGAMIGTPAYMSPEQALGQPVDQRSDLYSLGIILYEMVTGRVPYEADTPLAVVLKHVNAPLPLPSSVKPGLPAGIEKVLLKVLAKEPADRFATTEEFVGAWKAALLDAQAVAGTVAAPVAPPQASVVAPTTSAPVLTTSAPVPTTSAPVPTTSAPAALAAPAVAAPSLPASPARPATPSRKLLGPLGIAAALGGLLCGGGLCAVLVYNQFFNPGANPTAVVGGEETPVAEGATDEPSLPLGTLVAEEEETPAPEETDEPAPELGGTWTSWTAANTIFAVTMVEGELLTGGPGGLTAWDTNSGEVTQRFTTGDGLPGVYITALLNDTDSGGLYLGTDNGLVEIVGDEIMLHDVETGLDSSYIGAVAVVEQGLLVGTNYSEQDGGGLQLRVGEDEWERVGDFPSTTDTEANPDQLSNAVTALLADADAGELWVGTSNGLGRYDGSDWTRYGLDEGLPDPGITALALVDGTLLVGTEAGLAFFNGDTFEAVEEAPFTPVFGLVAASDGQLWVSGGGGIARRNTDGEWDVWDYLALPAYSIYQAVEDDDGVLYFGTDVGVVRFEGDDYDLWTAPDVPVSAAFGRVLPVPDEDQLWFVQEYGDLIDIFARGDETWLPGPARDCYCPPLAWDADGRLWAGGDLGLWIFDGEEVAENYTADNGLPQPGVWAVAFDADGTAWIGTAGGLVRYADGEITDVYDASNSGLTSDAVNGLLAASDSSLWVMTELNLSRLMPDGEWVTYGNGDPFSYDVRVSDLAEDPDGNIWVSTWGDGLFRYRLADDEWDRYAPEVTGVDLLTNEFTTIAAGPDGQVWAGAYFAGFARFDGERWQSFGDLDGLIHSNVNDIYVDEDGVAWFATSGGVSRHEP